MTDASLREAVEAAAEAPPQPVSFPPQPGPFSFTIGRGQAADGTFWNIVTIQQPNHHMDLVMRDEDARNFAKALLEATPGLVMP